VSGKVGDGDDYADQAGKHKSFQRESPSGSPSDGKSGEAFASLSGSTALGIGQEVVAFPAPVNNDQGNKIWIKPPSMTDVMVKGAAYNVAALLHIKQSRLQI
jgi:hypothetical protein